MFVSPDPNLNFPAFYFSMICLNPFTWFDSPNEDLATVFLGRPNTPIRHVLPKAPLARTTWLLAQLPSAAFSSATTPDQLSMRYETGRFHLFHAEGMN
jgi:hypothetical protein